LQILSEPAGLPLTAGLLNQASPYAMTAIEGSNITLAAPEKSQLGGVGYAFSGWSDNGARVHTIVASASTSYVASFTRVPSGERVEGGPEGGGGEALLGGVMLTRHPHKRTSSSLARFAFRVDGFDGRFRCKLDSGRFRGCASPQVYRRLRDGSHVFRVYAVGAEGGAVTVPATFRWKVVG
jgi:hypothetical protein